MSITKKFSIVQAGAIKEKISRNYKEIEKIVSDVYYSHKKKQHINPASSFLRFPDQPQNRIIALPAHVSHQGEGVSGVKWIASYPGNPRQEGIPRASGVLILNCGKTGFPFACMEAGNISSARTAASATLGAYYLNHKKRFVRQICFIGAGAISEQILRFFKGTGWDFDDLVVYDQDIKRAEMFCEMAQFSGKRTRVSSSLKGAIEDSDIVVFATTALEPYVHASTYFSHAPIVLHISLRDLSEKIMQTSFNITDDTEHCLQANTSLARAVSEIGHKKFIDGTIADCIDENLKVPQGKTRIFSPFGMGILDIAVGTYIYEKCSLRVEIEDFF
ncbi:MAG: 2,3-diaminopropionate biosynthesis protein SbnB [Alphaproteobacteria bacterium]|jgi:N-[(2S)-2-amino-2-carboxyethyl]-L-glutamate dehydrogenase|nr:2,3-diaminopropionate biosynthesis protein SbnB [Alphaproteobacteria bacterium]MBT5389558.1 2,3-diaminopropionate biosynthesis protein SbnB [Alphaproteobacteria bacterium]